MADIIKYAQEQGYSLDEIADILAKDAGYNPTEIRENGYSTDEIFGKLGYATKPEKKPESGDFMRGIGESAQQLPQLAYGAAAGVGAIGENIFGQGGVSTALKEKGVAGYNEWGKKIAAESKPTDSLTYSLEKADEGDYGALVDWLQHGLGYAVGQGAQMLGTAGIGSLIGKFGLKTVAEGVAGGMVNKAATAIATEKLGATATAEAIAGLAASEAVKKAAVSATASKIGQAAALGGAAYGMEGGEIFGDLTASAQKEGRQLTGDELAKAFGATLAAGSLEFVGDKVGVDLILGKSGLLNPLKGITGVSGRAARAAVGGVAGATNEGLTEYFQTGWENYGKGEEENILPFNQSEKAQRDAFDSAGLGAIGGHAFGTVGGAFTPSTKRPAEVPNPDILNATSFEQARDAAAADLDSSSAIISLSNIDSANEALQRLYAEEERATAADAEITTQMGQQALSDEIAQSAVLGATNQEVIDQTPVTEGFQPSSFAQGTGGVFNDSTATVVGQEPTEQAPQEIIAPAREPTQAMFDYAASLATFSPEEQDRHIANSGLSASTQKIVTGLLRPAPTAAPQLVDQNGAPIQQEPAADTTSATPTQLLPSPDTPRPGAGFVAGAEGVRASTYGDNQQQPPGKVVETLPDRRIVKMTQNDSGTFSISGGAAAKEKVAEIKSVLAEHGLKAVANAKSADNLVLTVSKSSDPAAVVQAVEAVNAKFSPPRFQTEATVFPDVEDTNTPAAPAQPVTATQPVAAEQPVVVPPPSAPAMAGPVPAQLATTAGPAAVEIDPVQGVTEGQSLAGGQASKWRMQFAQRMVKMFSGRQARFYKGGRQDGFSDGKSVWINADSKIDLVAVAGHEWRHMLKGTEHHDNIQKATVASLTKLNSRGLLRDYIEYYNPPNDYANSLGIELAEGQTFKDYLTKKLDNGGHLSDQEMDMIAEEFSADVTGNMWRDTKALQEVFDSVIEAHPPSMARTIIRAIGDSIIKFLNKLIAATPKSGFKTGEGKLKVAEGVELDLSMDRADLEAIREQVKAAMRDSFIQSARGKKVGESRGTILSSTKKDADERKGRTLDEVRSRIAADHKLTIAKNPRLMIDGKPFVGIDTNEPGKGVLFSKKTAAAKLRAMMDKAVAESLLPAEEAAKITVPDVEFLDKAFKLPVGARFWYELSAYGFGGGYFNLSDERTEHLIDIVAATSGGQKPTDNVRVAIAAMAQETQNKPVTVGVRDAASLTQSLSPEALQTHKFGNFSDTMQLLAGLRPGVEPLPTIDLQMAAVFKMPHADIASNPVMYETLSRFLIMVRDEQNKYAGKSAQPYESWQIQALAWVLQRGTKDPDSYDIAMPKIAMQLQDAGIPTPGGKVTEETLRDPRTPDILAPSAKFAGEAQTATIETRTMLTEVGKESAATFEQLQGIDAPWARKLREEFVAIQRRTMKALGQRIKLPERKTRVSSLVGQLMSFAAGKEVYNWGASRVDTDGMGTFEGDLSPNMRVPLLVTSSGGASFEDRNQLLTPSQGKFVLAVLGKALNQAAMASSQFVPTNLGKHQTFSILVRNYDNEGVPTEALEKISRSLGRPINYSQVANGWRIDINIGGFDPVTDQNIVRDAAFSAFGANADIIGLPMSYDSQYMESGDYDKAIDGFLKEIENAVQNSDTGRVGRTRGQPRRNLGDFTRVQQAIGEAAREQERAFKDWNDDARAKLAKRGIKFSPERPDAAGRGSVREGLAGDVRQEARGTAGRPQSAGDGRGRNQGRGVAYSEDRASAQDRQAPLAGAPANFGGPIWHVVAVAEQYARDNGITLTRQSSYVSIDEDRARRIADAYAAMPHAPNDPKVKEAFQNLINQTVAQYRALEKAGYKFWFFGDNDPLATNPWDAMRDLRDNKSMGVYPTTAGFGSSGFDVSDNPLMADTGIKWPYGGPDGKPKSVLANDLFRAVHDAFGHGMEGAGFRAQGEENAWQAHVKLFTGSAVGALTSETRGQNSWLNFGPNGAKNRTAAVKDTVFADQKTGLMPEWTWTEGRLDDVNFSLPRADVRESTQRKGLSATGIHYSKEERSTLSSSLFGTGLGGAELDRVMAAIDPRIKHRIYFYINAGRGINPESGVGAHAHQYDLDGLYDIVADPDDIGATSKDANEFETRILNRGYNGTIHQDYGIAVLIGKRDIQPQYLGTGTRPQVEQAGQAEQSAYGKTVASVTSNRSLPSGQMSGADWKRLMPSVMPDIDVSHLDDGKGYYKDQIVARPNVKLSTFRAVDTESPEFRNWFGKSVIVDADGKPRVMYHGTARDITTFRPKQADAIFLTFDPEFAEDFSDMSADWINRNEGTGEFDAETETVWNGQNIMPLYVRAENPFDFRNPAHTQALEKAIGYSWKGWTYYNGEKAETTHRIGDLERGEWDAIESEAVQDYIRANHDSFWVRERGTTNLAVFSPNQVKSASGNNGEFSRENPDIRFSTSRANALESYEYKVDPADYIDKPTHGWAGSNGEFRHISGISVRKNPDDAWYSAYFPNGDFNNAIGRNAQTAKTNAINEAVEKLDAHEKFLIERDAADEKPNIRYTTPRQQPWYYSQLEKGISGAKMKTQPANQWALWIKSQQQFKKDEVEWSGVLDYLAMRGKDKITSAELADWVAGNGVKVEEVVLGGSNFDEDNPTLPEGWSVVESSQYPQYRELASRFDYVAIDKDEFPMGWGKTESDAINDAYSGHPEHFANGQTKFGQYVLPGGENYKELLITLPAAASRGFKTSLEARNYALDAGITGMTIREGDDGMFRVMRDTRGAFRSSHFDQPNILAHIRFNERTDAEGRRVLFIEELQSDWGQKGKKEGFEVQRQSNGLPVGFKIVKEGDGFEVEDEDGATYADIGRGPGKTEEEAVRNALENLRITGERQGLPTAPFVTDTKAWTALALKRAIAYAADNGFDAIAWTTGEQQAERYDLSKKLDSIQYKDNGDGTYHVTAKARGAGIALDDNLNAKQLEDTVGKEIAKKIADGDGKEFPKGAMQAGYKSLTGLDLKVGGEGMKGYYDQIVPQVAKKLGAEVGSVSLDIRSSDAKLARSLMINPTKYENTQPGFTLADKIRGPQVLFSSTRIVGDSGRARTPEQLAMFKNTGREVEVKNVLERIREYVAKEWQQGIFDQFAPFRKISNYAYTLMRLSKGANGAFEAFMRYGKLKLVDGTYDADMTGGVINKVFAPLGKETTDFLYWVAGNRAERLAMEGKERLFSPQDIAAAKSLADGNLDFDYELRNGKTTRNRSEAYKDTLVKFNEFNKNVMDMAEQSGLIDGAARHLWEHEFYVPFYRVMENDNLRAMGIKKGLVRQEAFKQLRGGDQKLGDLLSNTLINWHHLIDAASKNRAAKAAVEAAAATGIARQAVTGEKDTVWYMDGGKKAEYKVEDKAVLQAITGLQYAGLRGPLWTALTAPKHWLTVGVTASPFFKVRNLIRDSVQAIATSDLSYNAGKNFIEGLKGTNRESQDYVSALAGGGLIRFGTMLEGREVDRTRQLIKQQSKDKHILDGEGALRKFYDATLEPLIAAYNEVGNRGEEINRMALYKQMRANNMDHATASLAARDLMDFSLQGGFESIRILSQVVPFFNARLQGMYKLGRASKENREHMATVVFAATLASLVLLGLAAGDPERWKRWKKREEWDKGAYWWVEFAGKEFRIPKPFELGAVSHVAERTVEAMFDNERDAGKRYAKAIIDLAKNQLAMNPMPQSMKPIIDLYANKDSFTGRPIETMAMSRLDPKERYTSHTTMPARWASNMTPDILRKLTGFDASPAQYDHLVKAYFGWLGGAATFSADVTARLVNNEPTRPALDYWKFATGGMVQDDPTTSRYISLMYEQSAELEQAHATFNRLRKEGNMTEAREYAADNADKLKAYRSVESIKKQISKINEQVRMIERSDKHPAEKRIKIRELKQRASDLAERLSQ